MSKKLLVPIILFVVLILGVGAFFFTRNSTSEEEAEYGIPEEVIPVLSPDELGLEMVARSDKKAVKLVLNKASDVQTIEFDLVYDADQASNFADDEGTGKVSRNVTDELEVDGESPFETKYYDLGSCSSGRCRYDTGVTEVQLQMKVTKTDGKIFQVEDNLEL